MTEFYYKGRPIFESDEGEKSDNETENVRVVLNMTEVKDLEKKGYHVVTDSEYFAGGEI